MSKSVTIHLVHTIASVALDIDSIMTTIHAQVTKNTHAQKIFSAGPYISHALAILDVDECAEDTDTCAQACTNTNGSYTCSCDPGYRLASDNRHCDGMLG